MKLSIKKYTAALLAIPVLALGIASVVPHTAWAEDTSGADLSIQGGVDASKGSDQATDLFGSGGMFTIITNVLLFIIGAISVIMLVIGGIRYTTSAGDSTAVTSAKNTILYAIVGIVVALLAYAVVNWVVGQFAGK